MVLGEYLPFWNKLTESQRMLLKENAREVRFEKGMLVHGGADGCSGLLLVTAGQLRVFMISDEGRELTLYRLLERDICLFSGPCMVKNIQFDVTVEAEQDSVVTVVLPEVYKKLMEQSAVVSNFTNELMASRFSDVMWLMDQVLNKKMDGRLAAFLLEEGRLTGSRELSITHEQIAHHLGTAREVVTRLLRLFQTDHLVKITRGSVELLDEKGLELLAADSLR
ncbi:Crp/Fnr family transcriptional regulator [Lacrimispora indolis]|uniref:Crp/Fnr family transcriptional regulator n=1 Tax=Lacrimispora indolis TaxID=69825 RepID=UPI00045EB711|nr:Crp/Fnr family transcriptional regulator [Lacrimispora indolis]